MEVSIWFRDAELAGKVERGHKVYLSLLIARCVEPGEGQGRKNFSTNVEKCSLKRFSEMSGISDMTVRRYLDTWDLMALDGIVPPREELTPGVDVDLPDQAKWKEYYRQANPPKTPSPKKDGQISLPAWTEGGWDNEVLASRRYEKIAEVMHNAADGLQEEGLEGEMLYRVVESITDFTVDSNKIKAMARLMHSVIEFTSHYRSSRR